MKGSISNPDAEMENKYNESKNHAAELSDEEMENIAGGKAIIRMGNIDTGLVMICYNKDISFKKFEANVFVQNTCKKYTARNITAPRSCKNCKDYLDWDSIDHSNLSNDYYREKGFDIGVHPY